MAKDKSRINKIRPYGHSGTLAALFATGRRITTEQRVFALYGWADIENPALRVAAHLHNLRKEMAKQGVTIPKCDMGPNTDGGIQVTGEDLKKLRAIVKDRVGSNPKGASAVARVLRETADLLEDKERNNA